MKNVSTSFSPSIKLFKCINIWYLICLKKEQKFSLVQMVLRQMWAAPRNGSWGCGRCRGVAGPSSWEEFTQAGELVLRGARALLHLSHSSLDTLCNSQWRCFPWCVGGEMFWWKARTYLPFYETGTKRNKFRSLSWHQSHQLHWQEIPTSELQPGSPHLIYCVSGTARAWFLSKSNTKSVILPQCLERATSAIHLSLFSFSYRQHVSEV